MNVNCRFQTLTFYYLLQIHAQQGLIIIFYKQINIPDKMQNQKFIDITDLLFQVSLGANIQSLNNSFQQPKQRKQKTTGKKTHQKWTMLQNKAYLDFILQYSYEFIGESERRRSKIYKRMSESLALKGFKKSSEQCRGHHKKLRQRVGSFENIVAEVQYKIKNQQNKQKKRQVSQCISIEKNQIEFSKQQSQQQSQIKEFSDNVDSKTVSIKSFGTLQFFEESEEAKIQFLDSLLS